MSELQEESQEKRELDEIKKRELDKIKEIKQEKKESCCGSFFTQIKNFWAWFYSGKIRGFIDLFLEGWSKWTFWGNLGDLLAMLAAGVVNFGLPTAVREFFLQFVNFFLNTYLSLRLFVPVLIISVYTIKTIWHLSNENRVKKKIKRDDEKYNHRLEEIYENGFFSRAVIKFIWENFRGRLFDFIVTSLFLALMNLSGAWFIIYCVFVVLTGINIIKDIVVAHCHYCEIKNKKIKKQLDQLIKSEDDRDVSLSIPDDRLILSDSEHKHMSTGKNQI